MVPDSATLPPGGTQEFEVYLTGDIFGTGAFFELNQPEHGTMHIGERAAIYVAPAVPGNYQIRFFSIVDPSVDFIVPVVVTP